MYVPCNHHPYQDAEHFHHPNLPFLFWSIWFPCSHVFKATILKNKISKKTEPRVCMSLLNIKLIEGKVEEIDDNLVSMDNSQANQDCEMWGKKFRVT